MITETIDRSKAIEAGLRNVTSFVGLFTDTKPTGVSNGSTFLEMDTGDVYIFDAENEEWRAL